MSFLGGLGDVLKAPLAVVDPFNWTGSGGPNAINKAANSAGGKGGGGKGGTGVPSINPYQAAQADWLFNRPNVSTPTSSTVNTFPGQTPPPGQQVGFLQSGLTPGAAALVGPAPTPTGGAGGVKGGQGLTTSQTPATPGQSYASAAPGSQAANATGGVFPNGVPTTPGAITTTLPPALLALQNAGTTAQANAVADALGRQQAMAGGSLPALPSDPAAFDKNIADTMYGMGADNLQRTFARQLGTLDQNLANRGLAYGGEGASRALQDFSYGQNQALKDLASQSTLAGGQEASRQLQSIAGIRSQQMNELNSLLGLNPVGQVGPQGAGGATDILGAFGLNQQNNLANQAQQNAVKGGNTQAATSLATILALLK